MVIRNLSRGISGLRDDLTSLKYPDEIINAIIVNMQVTQLEELYVDERISDYQRLEFNMKLGVAPLRHRDVINQLEKSLNSGLKVVEMLISGTRASAAKDALSVFGDIITLVEEIPAFKAMTFCEHPELIQLYFPNIFLLGRSKYLQVVGKAAGTMLSKKFENGQRTSEESFSSMLIALYVQVEADNGNHVYHTIYATEAGKAVDFEKRVSEVTGAIEKYDGKGFGAIYQILGQLNELERRFPRFFEKESVEEKLWDLFKNYEAENQAKIDELVARLHSRRTSPRVATHQFMVKFRYEIGSEQAIYARNTGTL